MTVDSKKLEYGCRVIYDGILLSCFGIIEWQCSSFLVSSVAMWRILGPGSSRVFDFGTTHGTIWLFL